MCVCVCVWLGIEGDKNKVKIHTEFRTCGHIYLHPTFLKYLILFTRLQWRVSKLSIFLRNSDFKNVFQNPSKYENKINLTDEHQNMGLEEIFI